MKNNKDIDLFQFEFINELARKNSSLYGAGDDQFSLVPFTFQSMDSYAPGTGISTYRYFVWEREYWINGTPGLGNRTSFVYGYFNFTFVPTIASVNNYEIVFGLWQTNRVGTLVANPLITRSTTYLPFAARSSYSLVGGDSLVYQSPSPILFCMPYISVTTDVTGIVTGNYIINFTGWKITFN